MLLTLKQPLSNTCWMNIGEEGMPFVAQVEQTNFVPSEWYGGKHLLYVSNHLSTQDPNWGMSQDELLEAYELCLQCVNAEFTREQIEDCKLYREPSAQPTATPNYSPLVPALQTPVENLILANTTQIYPEDRGTNYSVRLGRQAAEAAPRGQQSVPSREL